MLVGGGGRLTSHDPSSLPAAGGFFVGLRKNMSCANRAVSRRSGEGRSLLGG